MSKGSSSAPSNTPTATPASALTPQATNGIANPSFAATPQSTSGTTTSSTSSLPDWLQTNLQNLDASAITQAQQPLQQYGGSLVAGFTPAQTQAFDTVNNSQGITQPYLNTAANYLQQATTPLWSNTMQFSPQNVQQYMNPYTNDVVNATENQFANTDAQQQQQLAGQAIQSGAWGGDRVGVAQGILGGQQAQANNATIANLYNQAYNTGLSTFGQQQQAQLGANEANSWLNSQAGSGMAALGNEAQQAALSGAGAQLQTGALQQQLAQSQLNIPYEQFTQQQAYPYQNLNFLSGIETGNNGGSTTSSSTTPSPSLVSQLAGLGTAGLGLAGSGALSGLGGVLSSLFGGTPTSTLDSSFGSLGSSDVGSDLGTLGSDALSQLGFAARGGVIRRRADGGDMSDDSSDSTQYGINQLMRGLGMGMSGPGGIVLDQPLFPGAPSVPSNQGIQFPTHGDSADVAKDSNSLEASDFYNKWGFLPTGTGLNGNKAVQFPGAQNQASSQPITLSQGMNDRFSVAAPQAAGSGIPDINIPDSTAPASLSGMSGYSAPKVSFTTPKSKLAGFDLNANAYNPDFQSVDSATAMDAIQHPKIDPWMSVIKAGLAAASGRSPYALQNIASGAESGVSDYEQRQQQASGNAEKAFDVDAKAKSLHNQIEQIRSASADKKTALAEKVAESQDKNALTAAQQQELAGYHNASLGIEGARLNNEIANSGAFEMQPVRNADGTTSGIVFNKKSGQILDTPGVTPIGKNTNINPGGLMNVGVAQQRAMAAANAAVKNGTDQSNGDPIAEAQRIYQGFVQKGMIMGTQPAKNSMMQGDPNTIFDTAVPGG